MFYTFGLELFLLKWFRSAARRGQPVEQGGATVFPGSLPARCFFGPVIVVFAAIGLLALFDMRGIEWYYRGACVPMIALAWYAYPRAVRLDPIEGVSRRNWLGVRETIAWPDVSALEYNRKTGELTVRSQTDKIRCSAFMVAPAVFCREIYRHARALGPMPVYLAIELGAPLPSER